MIYAVVAGQTPPPVGGQNLMVQRVLNELQTDCRICCRHWQFRFNPTFRKVRAFSLSKLFELTRVLWRLWQLQRAAPIDWLLFPSGGPDTVPMLRDLVLLSVARRATRRLWVQFHAAGAANRIERKPDFLAKAIQRVYSSVDGAIIMANSNRADPEILGISNIKVIPHKIIDENPNELQPDLTGASKWILHAGHQSVEKGTPELVEGFSMISQRFPDWGLLLLGEFLPSYPESKCREDLDRFRITKRVEILGLREGKSKAEIFHRAHLFAFPSRAPYESFGLVLIEAMMWGLPILAIDWRSNTEVLHGGSNHIIPNAGNLTRQIADGLKSMIQNPERMRITSESNRALFKARYRKSVFDWPYVELAIEDCARNLKI